MTSSTRRSLALLLTLVTVVAVGCDRAEAHIDRSRVERIVSTLAADEMEGRQAFTAGAERAAEFIRGEFEAIGLESFGDLDGYLQEFPVYSVAVESLDVVLDGEEIPRERLAASLSGDAIHWTEEDPLDIVVVEPDDDPMQAFSSALRSQTPTLVLMSSTHADGFGRLQGFLSRPSRTLEGDGGSESATGNPGSVAPGSGDAEGNAPTAGLVVVLTDATEVGSLRVDATTSRSEETLANVVGIIPGERSDELVLFSAHYDHIGIREPVDGDSIANGANDDASGTTAVIELARYFAARATPERTLVFVAFTAEEAGGYGSRHFSRQLDPDRIVAMFNIEMIGKVAAQGPRTVWITGFERSSFGRILQDAVAGTEYSFVPDPYPDQNLFYRSDNATLARLGVPAHSLSTTPIDVDPDYHRVTDEVDTLDLEHMTETIRGIALAAEPIVSGVATPTRVDPATVE